MTYPSTPGFKAPGTSEAAAHAIAPDAETLREQTFRAIEAIGRATADEAAAWLDMTVLAIRPRVTELAKAGRIIFTGETRENDSGKPARVYTAKTIERRCRILLESCDWRLDTIKARIKWLREIEAGGRGDTVVDAYCGTADEIERMCRVIWNDRRAQRQ